MSRNLRLTSGSEATPAEVSAVSACVRAGGYAQAIDDSLQLCELPIRQFRDQLRAALVAEQPTVSEYELQRALRAVGPEILVSVLLQALQLATHAPEQDVLQIQGAPSLQRRRPRGASSERKKRA